MVKMALDYLGELRVQAQHEPSGTTLNTDAPLDNHGKGESFSPTDLVATALGTCMATTMGIQAEELQVDLRGMKIHVEKVMSPDAPRRIHQLIVQLQIPTSPEETKKAQLETTALTCPVAQSISPNIQMDTSFQWGTTAK